MKKITFKRQVFIGIMLIAVGNILALILDEGLCANIAWVLYGIVLIINPVHPEGYNDDVQKAKWGIRIAGFICVLVGVLTRYVV